MNNSFSVPCDWPRCSDNGLFELQQCLAKTIYNQLKAHSYYDESIAQMFKRSSHDALCSLALDLAAQQTMILKHRYNVEEKSK